jgi:uncharacterized membrane protein YidH (DUF202 family)
VNQDGELPPRDPGLASERTALAWNRSGLAVLGATALILRRLWPLDGYRSGVVLGIVAVGAGLWAVGMVTAHRSRIDRTEPGLMTTTTGRILTAGTLILAAAGFLLGLLSVR